MFVLVDMNIVAQQNKKVSFPRLAKQDVIEWVNGTVIPIYDGAQEVQLEVVGFLDKIPPNIEM